MCDVQGIRTIEWSGFEYFHKTAKTVVPVADDVLQGHGEDQNLSGITLHSSSDSWDFLVKILTTKADVRSQVSGTFDPFSNIKYKYPDVRPKGRSWRLLHEEHEEQECGVEIQEVIYIKLVKASKFYAERKCGTFRNVEWLRPPT